MIKLKLHPLSQRLVLSGSLLLLTACNSQIPSDSTQSDAKKNLPGFALTFEVGSALGDFCQQVAEKFNQQQPKLENGKAFYIACKAKGSGDVVTDMLTKARQFKAGSLPADSAEFPTLLAVDGEIYQSQLIYEMNQLFPGQNYIPAITDSPLIAYSPMVFMAQSDLAKGLQKVPDLFKVLVNAKTHREIDSASPPQKIYYVQTAPTRSNSGLQTLVAQFASVSGKRPETLTLADVKTYQPQVQQIQQKVTRYGSSTDSLAKAMVQNGPFWASMGSVYESSVIEANSSLQPEQPHYDAIYPKATFSSNMRAILPQAPWISADEKAAAEKVLAYLQTDEAQQIATSLGLRPGKAGFPLGAKFTTDFGVDPQARYDSYRPPRPEVVNAMLKSWQEFAKKPSRVVVVIDTSGSMTGLKLTAVQNTLKAYVDSLGPQEQIALIRFSGDISSPTLVDGTPQGRDRGLQFISSLQANGNTKLYDSTLYARNWLQKNLRKDAINAVLILTDGDDTASKIKLDDLGNELKKSGFNSDQRIAFFTVGYGKEGEFNPDALKQIASLNGGYYSKGEPSTIARLMADLQVEF
jgi:Ca-activated chloride channel family protein